MKKLITLSGLLLTVGCAEVKPVLRDVNDIARALCRATLSSSSEAAQLAQKEGISLEQAAEILCGLQRVFDPFLEELLKAQRAAAQRRPAGSAP